MTSLDFYSVRIIPSTFLSRPFLINLMAIFKFLEWSCLLNLEMGLVDQHIISFYFGITQ